MKASCFQKCSDITGLVGPCAGLCLAQHAAWEEGATGAGGSCGLRLAVPQGSRKAERPGEPLAHLVWHG